MLNRMERMDGWMDGQTGRNMSDTIIYSKYWIP